MGIMAEQVYMTFGGKRYYATRARFSTLIAETIKSSLPNGFRLNSITTSLSSESQYVIITHENKIYYLRFSSHCRKKGVKFAGKNFYTFNFNDFSDMKIAISDFLLTTSNFLKLSVNRYLALSAVADMQKHENPFSLHSLEGQSTFKRLVTSLYNYGLVIINNEMVQLSQGGFLILKSKKKLFPKQIIESFEITQQLHANELIDMIEQNRYILPKHIKTKKSSSEYKLSETYLPNALKATLGQKEYRWFIPKRLRGKFQLGDQVRVLTKYGSRTVTITELILVDEETKSSMKPAVKLVTPKSDNFDPI